MTLKLCEVHSCVLYLISHVYFSVYWFCWHTLNVSIQFLAKYSVIPFCFLCESDEIILSVSAIVGVSRRNRFVYPFSTHMVFISFIAFNPSLIFIVGNRIGSSWMRISIWTNAMYLSRNSKNNLPNLLKESHSSTRMTFLRTAMMKNSEVILPRQVKIKWNSRKLNQVKMVREFAPKLILNWIFLSSFRFEISI